MGRSWRPAVWKSRSRGRRPRTSRHPRGCAERRRAGRRRAGEDRQPQFHTPGESQANGGDGHRVGCVAAVGTLVVRRDALAVVDSSVCREPVSRVLCHLAWHTTSYARTSTRAPGDRPRPSHRRAGECGGDVAPDACRRNAAASTVVASRRRIRRRHPGATCGDFARGHESTPRQVAPRRLGGDAARRSPSRLPSSRCPCQGARSRSAAPR